MSLLHRGFVAGDGRLTIFHAIYRGFLGEDPHALIGPDVSGFEEPLLWNSGVLFVIVHDCVGWEGIEKYISSGSLSHQTNRILLPPTFTILFKSVMTGIAIPRSQFSHFLNIKMFRADLLSERSITKFYQGFSSNVFQFVISWIFVRYFSVAIVHVMNRNIFRW